MKQYPSISAGVIYGLPVYVFDKLDGSNIRCEWSRKRKKFTKFGSRHVLIGEDQPFLGKSIALIKEKYEESLTEIFMKKTEYPEVTCFFEYYSPNSFAGFHAPDDADNHTVTLIDANVYKKGFMFPNEFVKLFATVETAPLLHVGNITVDIEEQIRSSTFLGVTFEGVICKAATAIKRGYPPTTFKIKSRAWREKLKEFCKGDTTLENQLL